MHFTKLCKLVYPWEPVSEIQSNKESKGGTEHFMMFNMCLVLLGNLESVALRPSLHTI